MKKVLIYTYKHSNYGAVLQAYALRKYLASTYSADVKIVDFTTDDHLKEDRVIKTAGSLVERIVFTFFNVLHFKEIKRRNNNIESFKNKYLIQTKRFSSVEELIANNPCADIYITGSDQVFNPSSNYFPVYYLNFDKGPGVKVAYAPSFGISNFTNDITEKIRALVEDFDYLSCRESVGADYLSSIIGHDVPTVCDPTLLLSQDEWASIATTPSFKNNYILVYDINGGDNIIRLAKRISKYSRLPIVCITRKTHKHYNVDKIVRDAGPSEFVGWFKDASYVITDSFHGTVFSWMFNKDFFYYLAYEATSSRATNLLKHLGCGDRIVKRELIDIFNPVGFKPYNKKNITLIKASKHYIDSFMRHE